jgi:HEAT repeat protein
MALAVVLMGRGASAQQTKESFEGWNLEPGVGQAHLVMVAKLVSIGRVTVVEGAKTDVVLREYRFQPVKRLKGIFGRDQLSMTSADLGLPAEDASSASPLKEGEFRLLILAQQRGAAFGSETFGCVSATPGATTFEERVPLVTGPDDPLVGVVETLIKVVDARSRRERAALLVDRLVDVDGLAAVPLLTSLELRADWAAADERAYAPLVRLAGSPYVAVRSAALEVLQDMLASRNIHLEQIALDGVADALRKIIDSDEANTRVRVAAIEALGNLITLKGDDAGAQKLLIAQLTGAATHAERAAAVRALSRIGQPQAATAVHSALAALPLDEQPAREAVYIRAAVRFDSAEAERILLARLKRSIAARQSLEAEIEPLGRRRSEESLPLLLAAAADMKVSPEDRQHIAWTLGRLKDDQAVPVLIGWLRGNDYQLKEHALAALENIDSETAAREVRPLLKSEAHLPYKLRMARLLARHGIDDGYALATEHLADNEHTAAAALVLAALDDPRTSKDLSEIVSVRPDRRWYAAALTGLAAIGDADARKQLREILANDRNPLAADAAEAAGLIDDKELLVPLAKLVQSRNKQIARASLVALRRFLSGVRTSPRGLAAAGLRELGSHDGDVRQPAVEIPAKTRDALAEAVASLVVDAYVDADVRQEAFAVARLLGGEKYSELLSNLADQAELEGTPLLAAVQAEGRRTTADIEN